MGPHSGALLLQWLVVGKWQWKWLNAGNPTGSCSCRPTLALLLLQAQGSGKDVLDVSGLQDQFSGGQGVCMQLEGGTAGVLLACICSRPAAQTAARHAPAILPRGAPACPFTCALQPCAQAHSAASPAAAPPTSSFRSTSNMEEEERED